MGRVCPHCGAEHAASTTLCPATGLSLDSASLEAESVHVGSLIAGRYHLVRLLGDGGMGAVYKAADQVLRRFVAIKMLHASVARNPSAVERFQREARAAAAIGHPNIIDILDFGTEDRRPYMVMEYLRGRSLSQVLTLEGSLAISRACAIATHTLAGLAAAHDRGILHRDLKPANLMIITHLNDRSFVKVCDFGFAALFGGSGEDGKTLTPERTLVGTPAYASPERLRGDDRRDPRTDVYSVGVLLFEMLTGRRPFEAPTFAELARKVRNEPAPALRSIRRDVPAGLEKVVDRALTKVLEERWESAAAFAEALVPFGGRTVALDEPPPSDSFTFQSLGIKPQAVRRRSRSSMRPPPPGGERHPPISERHPPYDSVQEHGWTGTTSAGAIVATDARARREDVGATRSVADRSSGEREHAGYAADEASELGSVRGLAAHDDIPIEVEPEWHEDSRSTQRRAASVRPEAINGASKNGHARPEAEVAIDVTMFDDEAGEHAGWDVEPSEMRVGGTLVLAVLRFVGERFGQRGLRQVLESLPRRVRAPFDAGIDAGEWVDFEALRALIERVDAELGQDDLHLVGECGRAAADGAFEALKGVRAPGVSPEVVVSELGSLLPLLAEGLELHVRRLGKGYARFELIELGAPSLTTSVFFLGLVERTLLRYGAEELEVNLHSSRSLGDEQTLYDVSWLG